MRGCAVPATAATAARYRFVCVMTTNDGLPSWAPRGVWMIVTAWVAFFVLTLLLGSRNTIAIAFGGFFLSVVLYGREPPTTNVG